MKRLAYYVTAHGYGHGVRSCDIIGAIRREHPAVDVEIVSALGAGFFDSRLASRGGPVRPHAFDVGMVQKDAIRVDVDATLARALELKADCAELLAGETEFLETRRIDAVVVDIPGIPMAAAALSGIPALAVGNFSWDWIYAPFSERDARWATVIEMFRQQYLLATLLLRLPFSGDMSAFPVIEDVPLLASPGKCRRAQLAAKLGLPETRKWVLLSFTSLDWDPAALARLAAAEDYVFLTMQPCDWSRHGISAIGRGECSFQDVVASVDVVVSKPGYGILSECIANGKPLVYVDREDFAEYPVLVESIQRYLRHAFLPAEALYRGELGEALETVGAAAEPPERMAMGGAEIAANRIVSFLQ